MLTYIPPIEEQVFVLDMLSRACPAAKEAALDLGEVKQILQESGNLAADILCPLNVEGDRVGAKLVGQEVQLPEGFRKAYDHIVQGGWNLLDLDAEFGGQGLPFQLSCCVQEQMASANLAFSLLLTLSQGAATALLAYGSDQQRMSYLPRLVSGELAATMNLTEPQAGSDLAAIRTSAARLDDGRYAIKGSKIFITFGEHGLSDNILHLVLARLPDAPEGVRGLSLFLVPKLLPDGDRNGLRCTALEKKMGIHASPTCAMSFGEDGPCLGELLGEENQGLRVMFAMMNHARISVGVQGVAIAERALQAATRYARERVQGKRIIDFPDVRRMLLTMRAMTEASRAITYFNAAAVDRGHAGDATAQSLADLLTPITKAFSSDVGVEAASLAMQVFGGMGFIEETGIAQLYRDIRIAPIYEGTNGIQALDLVRRKLPMRRWEALFDEFRQLADIDEQFRAAFEALERSTHWLMANPGEAEGGATAYLRMFATVLGAYLLFQQAKTAEKRDSEGLGTPAFHRAKIATAKFFARHFLPMAAALEQSVTAGNELLFELDEEHLERS